MKGKGKGKGNLMKGKGDPKHTLTSEGIRKGKETEKGNPKRES
jgi:hypothetical protein